MKKLLKKLVPLILALLLAFAVSACSAISEKDIKEYGELIGDVIDIVSDISQTDATDEKGPETRTDASEDAEVADNEDPVASEAGSSTEPESDAAVIDKDGKYTSKEDVALYIHTYGCLPSNFVTKNEARNKGWSGGSLENYFPGCSIGGDKFGNNEGLLPKAKGRQYYECDIDTMGASSRGAKRIVYSNDGLIYYTDDHYESFTLLYGEE